MHRDSHNGRTAGRQFFCVVALLICVFGGRAAQAEELYYETHVEPILSQHCTGCHSAEKRKGELDLSSAASLMRGGESGAVFEAGAPDESHLYEMVHKGEMPKKGDPLSHQQVETIRKWIAGGAAFKVQPKTVEAEINQHDVLPVMLLRCTACHGPRRQDGKLQLHTAEAILAGGENGPALVPGDPDASRMIQRIESHACPPQKDLLRVFVQRPPSGEVKKLREWISAGAPVVDVAPDVATAQPDPLVSDEDRQHWSFQPPKKPVAGDSVDDFVHRKLKEKGLTFSPQAGRDTLIRRVYLDLIGLPPRLDEWRHWRSSDDSDWYQKMIDELLDSPRYGERLGRYWLDLAGYADSEGGVSSDPLREVAWKYRDYVIDAFNADKPYDRFLLEQLAGDELLDVDQAEVVTDQMVENLVATGFLRMGIDQTGSRTMNYVPERIGVIADVINVVGGGVMGLTMDCVRCHTHKYDPIPHRDYYRMKAVFQGAFDEHDWLSFKTRTLEVGTPDHVKTVAAINPPLEKKIKALQSALKKATGELQKTTLREHYPELPEEDRESILEALRRAENQRSLEQKILVEKLQRAELVADAAQPAAVLKGRREIAAIEKDIVALRRQLEPPLAIRATWDRGAPSPTYILRRGDYDKSTRLVGPGVPSALTDGKTPFNVEPPFPGGTPKTGRRLAFARWLTRSEHPLTARVMVNRIWHEHFGTGLVKTLENFGIQGERPSHPELLDWLAIEFVERGWSIKEMHRLIMNSQTYRQSSEVSDEALEADPRGRLLSRMPLRRMNAEALRDSLHFVSGQLDLATGGPPDTVSVDRNGLVSIDPTENGTWRRSVYLQYRRTEIPTMMDTFDYPEMGPNCLVRSVSTVSPQSLMLMNNDHIRELAGAFAGRVEELVGGNPEPGAKVDAVYQLALSRSPDAGERQLGIDSLKALEAAWNGDSEGSLETYCHTILNSAAFVYVD